MTEYLCVIRDRRGCWVTATGYDCQDEARNYGDYFGDVVGLVAKRTGIRPPVGIKDQQCSHARVATVRVRGEEILGIGEKLVPR